MRTPPPLALEAAALINRLDRLARAVGARGRLNAAQWEALRYLARANRFSRTPAALACYLGATRGAVSQTLIALEQKGYVARGPNPRDARSVVLALTPLAERALRDDPVLALARDLAGAETGALEQVADALRAALRAHIARNGGRAFGVCAGCRHFRRDEGPSARAPHRCALLDEPLSQADGRAICVEQEAA